MPRVLAKESGEEVFMPAGGEAQARRFYGQMLGLRETMKTPGEKGVWFQTAEGLFKVTPKADFKPASDKPQAKFRIDKAEALREGIQRARWRVWDAPHEVGTRGFYAGDPFGNRIELRERPGV